MKVKVNLSNQTLEYMDSQPYIQGTDTRNVLNVYIEHEDNEVSNIMIAYALQNGRTTIKMANTGATQETIDETLYDVYYFTAPKVLTSISGNFVATLIIDVNTSVVGRVNTYKVNVLNTVLNAVEFEAFEDALDDVSSEFIETIEGMSSNITQLQNGKADYQNSSQNILLNSIYKGNERIGFGTNVGDTNPTSTIQDFGNTAFKEVKDSSGILLLHKNVSGSLATYEPSFIHTPSSTELYGSSATSTYNVTVHTYSEGLGTNYVLTFTNGLFKFNNYEVIDESKVVDDVTSTSTKYPLSANQGRVLKGEIDDEVTNRQSADSNLQSQIDGLNAGQNLADIVANLTALNNLDTTKLQSGDKVEVLSDSDHDNVSTVYNWSGTIWQYIGAYGMDAYTKAQMDSALALKQNVISSSNKISSDYVDDTNATNKFVTADEKQFWDAKQMALSDTDSIENVIWGDDDPNANYDIHVGVKVKDSYVESFFATDSEVQNMLSEVFN